MTVQEILEKLKELQRYDIDLNFWGDGITAEESNDGYWLPYYTIKKLIKKIEASQ